MQIFLSWRLVVAHHLTKTPISMHHYPFTVSYYSIIHWLFLKLINVCNMYRNLCAELVSVEERMDIIP